MLQLPYTSPRTQYICSTSYEIINCWKRIGHLKESMERSDSVFVWELRGFKPLRTQPSHYRTDTGTTPHIAPVCVGPGHCQCLCEWVQGPKSWPWASGWLTVGFSPVLVDSPGERTSLIPLQLLNYVFLNLYLNYVFLNLMKESTQQLD